MSAWQSRGSPVRANSAATRPATTRPSSVPRPQPCTVRARTWPWRPSRQTRVSASGRSTVTSGPARTCLTSLPTGPSSRCSRTCRRLKATARQPATRCGASSKPRSRSGTNSYCRYMAGPRSQLPETLAVRDQVHRAVQRIIERGRTDGTISQDVTPRDVVVFGAMLAQPRQPDPEWDATCRRLLATYLNGLRAC